MAGEYYPQGISPQSGALPSGLAGFQGVMAQGPSRMQTQADYELGNKQLNLAREQGYMQDSLQRDTMNQQRHFQWNLAEMEADQRRANRELQKYLADQQMKYYNKSLDANKYLTERGQDLTWDNAEAERTVMKDYMAKLMALAEARNLGSLVNGEQTASQDSQGKGPASESSAAQLGDSIYQDAQNGHFKNQAYQSLYDYTQAQISDLSTEGVGATDALNRLSDVVDQPVYPVGSGEYKSLRQLATGEGVNDPELAALALQSFKAAQKAVPTLVQKFQSDDNFKNAYQGTPGYSEDLLGQFKDIEPGFDFSKTTPDDLRRLMEAKKGSKIDPDLYPSKGKDPLEKTASIIRTQAAIEKLKSLGGQSGSSLFRTAVAAPGPGSLPGQTTPVQLGGEWLGVGVSEAPKDVKSMLPEILASARSQGLSRSQIMSEFYRTAFNPVTKQYDRAKARQFVFDLQNRLVSDILKVDPEAPVGLDAEVYGPTPGSAGSAQPAWPSGGTFPPLAARPGKLGVFGDLSLG